MNNDENFERGWTDYVNGFGDPNENYWIGLKKMHELTTSVSRIF